MVIKIFLTVARICLHVSADDVSACLRGRLCVFLIEKILFPSSKIGA